MRSRQASTLLILIFFVICSVYLLRSPSINETSADPSPSKNLPLQSESTSSESSHLETPHDTTKPHNASPKPDAPDAHSKPHIGPHPALHLIEAARKDFSERLARQSRTLDEAVAEYRRRYRAHPPPHFEKWFAFAKERGVEIIDDYDTIYDSLRPFWAIEPAELRERVREALGFHNSLMGVTIRNGQVVNVVEGAEWLQDSIRSMMRDFVQYLPDMDLPFNTHDEPRVIVQHDDLVRLVETADTRAIPRAAKATQPRNKWSARPKDLNDGHSLEEYRITRFNVFAHQPVWTNSRISCPPDSAARSLNATVEDERSSFSFSELRLIDNTTAFSDICNSPSLRTNFGFFDRPNAFDVVHDLFPIFSQSKVSSFQDILFPSPWYWASKVPYHQSQDYQWEDKNNQLWWRGSTTGGFSRDGGWRRQHRQKIVGAVNAFDEVLVYDNASVDASAPSGTESGTLLEKQPRTKYADLFDVHFSHVGQCDPGDCDAQREYFAIAAEAKQKDAWRYKYLLDVDGNAFSGRFYAFLQSRSAVFKMAIFREWHTEWLRPWLHYIPLSLEGHEWVELLRFFDRDPAGRAAILDVADQGRDWASRALRNVDLEAWLFRLLLEYGRLVDDERDILGFAN